MCLDNLKTNQSYYNLLNSAFWGWLSMEAKWSNAQHLVEWKTTALWRELKFGERHAIANGFLYWWYKYKLRTNSHYVYKYKLRKYSHYVIFTFCTLNIFLLNSGTPIFNTQKVNLTKRENFLTSNLYHKRRNAYAVAWHSQIFDSLPWAVIFNIQTDVEHWTIW